MIMLPERVLRYGIARRLNPRIRSQNPKYLSWIAQLTNVQSLPRGFGHKRKNSPRLGYMIVNSQLATTKMSTDTSGSNPDFHEPVMLSEVLDALHIIPGGRYLDATVGEGGHARAILHAASPGGQLLGIDADPEAIASAEKRLEQFGSSVRLVNENFVEMQAVATRYGFAPVHGGLMDLGVSSLQLDREERGFSFRRSDPLDMRFAKNGELDASQIVNTYSERELGDLIFKYGDERASRRIASAIVRNRPIRDAQQLAEIISAVKPRGRRHIHSATQTFQALRIAVNDEMTALGIGLEQAVNVMGMGGLMVVISYHSIEDRIVKNFIRTAASDCICDAESRRSPVCTCNHVPTLEPVIKGALMPTASEVEANPRSRSAKLRVARRI